MALARTQKAHADWPALYSTAGVHPTRCSEFEQNEFGNDPEKYFAHLVAVCEDGMADGTVQKPRCAAWEINDLLTVDRCGCRSWLLASVGWITTALSSATKQRSSSTLRSNWSLLNGPSCLSSYTTAMLAATFTV